MSDDTYRQIAIEAIDALRSEESTTESQFSVGNPNEDYYEGSKALRARLDALDASACPTIPRRPAFATQP
jgi:hypothetical protein